MRGHTILWGLLVTLSACGDSGTDTRGADGTGSQTDPSASVPTTPTSGLTGDATEADDGTESLSASGTTTSTSTTTPTPTTGPDSLTGTGDTGDTTAATSESSTTSSSTTTDDTGTVDFCSPPDDLPVEDVPLNEACDIPLQMGSFNPVIEWKYGSTLFYGPPVAGQTIDTNQSGQIDAQDLPHVFIYEGGAVVALRGDGSGVAWKSGPGYGNQGGLALGDLEGDGWNEIVTANVTKVCALDGRDGAQKWCANVPGTSADTYGYNNPSIADMDGDGLAEVILGSSILDSAGGILGTGLQGHGGAPFGGNMGSGSYGDLTAVVDLDADGVLEVVAGNAAYDLDGNTIWQNGTLDGLIAVADFDLDGMGEIVKTSGIHVFGMESDGTVVWGPKTYGGNLGAPAIDDLDGDGTPELVLGAQNLLVALEWGGIDMWSAPISDSSGAAGPVLFDFEKDGYPEVLYADQDAIRFFSGLDGSLKYQSMEHSSGTALETPIVADVDGDNHVEIVLGHGNANAQIGAVTVYGDANNTWPPGRKIWNQHGYHITNSIRLS
jgi:hypothetical protein